MFTLKQQFLNLPLVKENTPDQLEQVKGIINQVAVPFHVNVAYIEDWKNRWFKAEVEGSGPDVINFLMCFRSLALEGKKA